MITTEPNGVLKVDINVLKEKLNTPEGVTEVESKIKSIKGFNSDQLNEMLKNYGAAQRPIIENELKDKHYSDAKKATHEILEKTLKDKYGLTSLEIVKDYKDTGELVQKILDEKVKSAKEGKDDPEVQKMRDTILALTNEKLKIKDDTANEFIKEMGNMELNSNLALLDPFIDVEGNDQEANEKRTGFINYVRFLLQQEGIGIQYKDKKFIAIDKDGKPLTNETFQSISLRDKIFAVAQKHIPLKKSVPGDGRGVQDTTGLKTNHAIDWTQYPTQEKLFELISGKQLTPGSPESMEIIAGWEKAHNKKI